MIADETIQPKPAPSGVRRSWVHPAVLIVLHAERLWRDDKQIAGARAILIVQRLIEAGVLAGQVRAGVPLAADDAGPAGRGELAEP